MGYDVSRIGNEGLLKLATWKRISDLPCCIGLVTPSYIAILSPQSNELPLIVGTPRVNFCFSQNMWTNGWNGCPEMVVKPLPSKVSIVSFDSLMIMLGL